MSDLFRPWVHQAPAVGVMPSPAAPWWRSHEGARELPRDLGPRLRAARVAARCSVEYVARAAGISVRYVHYLEAGTRVPSLHVAECLIRAYGLTRRDRLGADLLECARPHSGRSSPYRHGWRPGDDPDDI